MAFRFSNKKESRRLALWLILKCTSSYATFIIIHLSEKLSKIKIKLQWQPLTRFIHTTTKSQWHSTSNINVLCAQRSRYFPIVSERAISRQQSYKWKRAKTSQLSDRAPFSLERMKVVPLPLKVILSVRSLCLTGVGIKGRIRKIPVLRTLHDFRELCK